MDTRQAGTVQHGLEGVVIAATRLSDVDGEAGRLVIAGHDVEKLARSASFEQAFAMLATEGQGGADKVDPVAVRAALAEGRVKAGERLHALLPRLAGKDGMSALRSAVADMGDATDTEIAGVLAVAAAAWSRLAEGNAPIAPDGALSHAADVLRMIGGDASVPARVRALDAYLVTVSDHGMNASTFTARVVASTGSDLVSSVTAAIGALKGPLHGGAPGPVLDMLDAIGTPDRAEAFLRGELEAKRRIMGMGHRIYRVRDPRAAVLEHALSELEAAGPCSARLALARAVEQAATRLLREKHEKRPLAANVEFYTAVLLDAVGLPRGLFAPMFAVGRVAGWCAHVTEERRTGRLIRPASVYVGPQLTP